MINKDQKGNYLFIEHFKEQYLNMIVIRYKKYKGISVKERKQSNMNHNRPEERGNPTKKRKELNGSTAPSDNLKEAMDKYLQHGDSKKGQVKEADKILEVVITKTNDSYTNIGQVKQLLVRVQQNEDKIEGWVSSVQRTNGFNMCMMSSMLGIITASNDQERQRNLELTRQTIQNFTRAIEVDQQREDIEEVSDEEIMNTTPDQ